MFVDDFEIDFPLILSFRIMAFALYQLQVYIHVTVCVLHT